MGDFGFVEMLLLCVLLAAALGAHVPQGEERRAILEAARKPLVEDIGQPIKFVLSTFLVQNGWAFYQGHPISASGSKINWLETKYKSDVEEGFFDENIQGLLRREGGRWVSKAHAVGCTDVCFAGWPDAFPAAPKQLFPTEPGFVRLDPAPRAAPRVAAPPRGPQGPAAGRTGVYTPEGAERREIVKAARVPITEELDIPTLFKFNHFKVSKSRTGTSWAYYSGQLLNKDGTPVDWLKTKYASDVREGFFDDNVFGLLKTVDGKWAPVAHAIGCTDMCSWGWADQFGAPKAIFGFHN